MSWRGSAKRAAHYLPLVITVALLLLIATQFDGWHLFEKADPLILLLALGLALFFDTVIAAFKWWRVILLAGIPATFVEVWKLLCGLLPVAFFAPFQSGHLLYAVALRNHKNIKMFHAIECVAYDKGLSLVGTFGLIALGQLLLPGHHPLSHPLIFVGSAAVVALFFADRFVFRLLARFRFFRERSRFLRMPVPWHKKLWLLPLAMVYQSSDTFSMYLGCLALGVELRPDILFGAFPVVLLLTYAPVSISGFGVRENLIAVFLAGSLTYNEAVSGGILVDLLEYVAPAVFGVVVLPHVLRVLWKLRHQDPLTDDADDTADDTAEPAVLPGLESVPASAPE